MEVALKMFRTIMALLVALLVAILIGAFQIVGLGIADLEALLASGDFLTQLQAWGTALFQVLLRPYTAATAPTPAYAPIVALGVAGFIAGLISKSGVRMLFVSLIAIAVFFVGYVVLSLGLALDLAVLQAEAIAIAIDLGASFGLLFIPGVIGASLTAEEY
jgi:hypothetical protein